MKTFEYRGFNQVGQLSSGLIEALDPKEAREKLAARGILAERVASSGQGRKFFRRRHFDLATRALLYHELGSLLRSGLPLTQALQVLIEAPELGENRPLLANLSDRIREGASLSTALAAVSLKVSPFEQAVLEAGQRSGSLDQVLAQLATFLDEQQKLQERIQTAMIYPVIILLLAAGVAAVMLGIMIPSMGKLLAETNIPLPPITRFMMSIGRWTQVLGLPVLGVLMAVAFLGHRRIRHDPEFKIKVDSWLFRWPVVGRGYTNLVNLRFARTLAMLTRGGLSVVDGLALAGRATGSPWVSARVAREAEAVKHGQSLADVVRRIPPLSGSLPGWIQAGEASGNLVNLLDSASERYNAQWDRLIARSLAVMEPLLILAVGGFVLLVALSILLPVLSLNKSLM